MVKIPREILLSFADLHVISHLSAFDYILHFKSHKPL